jgi:chemotaxis protein CheX
MKAKFINPFLFASMNLFREYLGIQARSVTPHLLSDPQDLQEVSAIIGLAGDTTGAVVLSFSRETAIALVSKLSGRSYSALTNEVLDGVGEMVNIIAGNAKKDLEDFRIVMSLPGVIVGSSYKIRWPEGIPVIAIPFESEIGPFSVNVSMRDTD